MFRMDQVPDLELTPEQQLDFVYQQMTSRTGIVTRLALAVFGDGNGDPGMRREIQQLLASRRPIGFWRRIGYDAARQVTSVLILLACGLLVLGMTSWIQTIAETARRTAGGG